MNFHICLQFINKTKRSKARKRCIVKPSVALVVCLKLLPNFSLNVYLQ